MVSVVVVSSVVVGGKLGLGLGVVGSVVVVVSGCFVVGAGLVTVFSSSLLVSMRIHRC